MVTTRSQTAARSEATAESHKKAATKQGETTTQASAAATRSAANQAGATKSSRKRASPNPPTKVAKVAKTTKTTKPTKPARKRSRKKAASKPADPDAGLHPKLRAIHPLLRHLYDAEGNYVGYVMAKHLEYLEKHKPDMTTSFPQFSGLPAELRAKIWELCLPRRLIPFSAIALAHDKGVNEKNLKWSDSVFGRYLWDLLGMPCLIEQVCREARDTARSCRMYAVGELQMPWLGKASYIDPRTDTILIDCDVRIRYRVVWRLVQETLGLGIRRPGRDKHCVSVGIMSEYVRYKHQWNLPGEVPPEEAPLPFRHRTWPIVMCVIYLDLPKETAKACGKFGLFGEERGALIPIRKRGDLAFLHGIQQVYHHRSGNPEDLVSIYMQTFRDLKKRYLQVGYHAGIEKRDGDEDKGLTETGPYPVIFAKWKDWRSSDGLNRDI
ncbi:hypothetical protein VTJ83DRAFT_3257 [Remersonia thermophila]|uniref:2EXR domain-containing protein n=1 Tax=Remersonia thermophila TaxID=72144 RepID=A0ABR4DDJ2_9PEZI